MTYFRKDSLRGPVVEAGAASAFPDSDPPVPSR
jgi:hypothetical protein